MSSSVSTPAPPTTSSSTTTTAAAAAFLSTNHNANAAQFREIHKNTWLKRLTADGKKVTVGPKKSERSWVVFCVHDDIKALLEGYAEPRQAAQHTPEWIVSMQDALHISHALIPNSHEFEFVVTLSNEVVRFHAMSWEVMQEWVDTLRSKLREMKILSPRENLYTKLPEIRAPLLPTRDPTSPLPAPPPVPAALVPGVERVIPQSLVQTHQQSDLPVNSSDARTICTTTAITTITTSTLTNTSSELNNAAITTIATITPTTSTTNSTSTVSNCTLLPMSNTLTQNLLNMLSDPISTYSEQLNDEIAAAEEIIENIDLNNADNVEELIENVAMNDSENDDNNEIEDNEIIGSGDEFCRPILRKSTHRTYSGSENSVRVDIGAEFHRTSADQLKNLENILPTECLIPRPHTSRSLVSCDQINKIQKPKLSSDMCNITELEIKSNSLPSTETATESNPKSNITIVLVSSNTNIKENDNNKEINSPQYLNRNTTGDVFKFPESPTRSSKMRIKQHDYKSNVQIIPSIINNNNNKTNNTSTIQVLGTQNVSVSSIGNQYSIPVKKVQSNKNNTTNTSTTIASTSTTSAVVTTVHVTSNAANASANDTTTTSVDVYGSCYTHPSMATNHPSSDISQKKSNTPKLSKKIILSANTSGITNITVNNTGFNDPNIVNIDEIADFNVVNKTSQKYNMGNMHYEKVFFSSSTPITAACDVIVNNSRTSPLLVNEQLSPKIASSNHQRQSTKSQANASTLAVANEIELRDGRNLSPTLPSSPIPSITAQNASNAKELKSINVQNAISSPHSTQLSHCSPILQRSCRILSPTNFQKPLLLTRGLTEAVITSRPSRRDFQLASTNKSKAQFSNSNSKTAISSTSNNNEESSSSSSSFSQPLHVVMNRTQSEMQEQRRRSSSTSDAQAQRSNVRNTNNNEFLKRRHDGAINGALRQPPQPFRSVENGISLGSNLNPSSPKTTTSPVTKCLTFREQQVMQLRREIMHPGGVRLQLRRKDCVGSIAWVDAFSAVWIAGWKQKEHPVLYNALHIGDQLLSIAGIAITSSTEANKIIRNTNSLFVEVLIRRLPFGRGYAIRREREGQCLGLIRDGNTSTIVDVVPNSLAARHGLPPKAQSCDGTTLTFWVLTEINQRPLNLFFKENEIHNRLNSVGRDISILVQPSDLIAKLKKQLKSLRGYKEYLLQ